jgi:hypothetical protein
MDVPERLADDGGIAERMPLGEDCKLLGADHADSRVLPSRDITDETIDDAYVAFILYCNPNVSSADGDEDRIMVETWMFRSGWPMMAV